MQRDATGLPVLRKVTHTDRGAIYPGRQQNREPGTGTPESFNVLMKEMQSLGLNVRPGSKDEQPSLQLGGTDLAPVDGMTEGFDSDDMAGLADVDFSDLKF